LVPAQRAAAINPRSAEAYYVLGRLLDELGQEAEVVKALKQSVEIDPGFGAILLFAEPHLCETRAARRSHQSHECL